MRTIEKNDLKFYTLAFLSSIFFIVLFLSACQKPVVGFGSSFVASNNTSIVEVDTSTVQLSTVLLDSFPTASTGSMLLGSYRDDEFGTITSKTFLQIGVPPRTTISNLATLDSISLIMRINKTFYSDTTVVQRYYVSQLTEPIILPYKTQFTYYNNSSFPSNPTPLGYSDVLISPTRALTTQNALDSVKIRLPDTLGQRLMVMVENNSDTVLTLNSFLGYFKGLLIYTDTTSAHSGAMFGFKDTVFLRMYYHEPGAVTTFYHLDFPFNNKSNQFNHITADRNTACSSQ